jgi:hypothetical protein
MDMRGRKYKKRLISVKYYVGTATKLERINNSTTGRI